MALTDEAREVVRQAAIEALTRRPTLDELYDEVVRYVSEAQTEEEGVAVGLFLGRVGAVAQALLEASPEPAPDETVS